MLPIPQETESDLPLKPTGYYDLSLAYGERKAVLFEWFEKILAISKSLVEKIRKKELRRSIIKRLEQQSEEAIQYAKDQGFLPVASNASSGQTNKENPRKPLAKAIVRQLEQMVEEAERESQEEPRSLELGA
ncbi:MAG: hypothetical protein AAB489_00660 [Patescibacteria group bacterium]